MSTLEERRARKEASPKVRLEERHTQNCQVLPTRFHLLRALPAGGVVAEIGAAFGDFTARILAENKPAKLHLVDAWASQRYEEGLSQIEEKFAAELEAGKLEIHRGLSTERLPKFPDRYFDWVYVDTDHSYETTRDELRICDDKVKPGGYIAGHDFTSGNPVRAVPYGVIEACNEFCMVRDWQYSWITLEPSGHFSFALSRQGEGEK